MVEFLLIVLVWVLITLFLSVLELKVLVLLTAGGEDFLLMPYELRHDFELAVMKWMDDAPDSAKASFVLLPAVVSALIIIGLTVN